MPGFKAVVKDSDGVVYTLSNDTYIGVLEPSDSSKTIWFDAAQNNIKIKTHGNWSVIGPGGCVTVSSPAQLPVGPSVIIVTGTDVAAGGSASLSFTSVPPAGSAVDIIVLPHNVSGSLGWTLVTPVADWSGWISGGTMPSGDTMLAGVTQATVESNTLLADGGSYGALGAQRNIFIAGATTNTDGPVYIRAISDGDRVYYIYQATAAGSAS